MIYRKKPVEGLLIHCSDSLYGNAKLINEWHIDRDFNMIGYHFVILNGLNNLPSVGSYDKSYDIERDGKIEFGRDTELAGAHCKGYNDTWLGLCLIGKHGFTYRQYQRLLNTIYMLRYTNKIPYFDRDNIGDVVKGHYEFNDHKTCPNIDMDWLRSLVIDFIDKKEREMLGEGDELG